MRDCAVVQPPGYPPTDRAAKARAEHERRAAIRRASDPAQLRKAVLTVEQAAIANPEVYALLDGILAARRGGGGAHAKAS